MGESWIGVVKATDKGNLIGGVKTHVSSRFATSGAAQRWCRVIFDVNRDAGIDCKAVVMSRNLSPEIDA